MNNNILYISFDGMTDPLGQSQVIPYLIGLSKHGYNITLLSCEKKDRLIQNEKQISILLNQNKITWISSQYDNSIPFFSQWKTLTILKRKAIALANKKQFSIVHTRSYMAALIGLKIKNNGWAKFIFDMRGFWADERIDGGIWKKSNPIQRFLYNYFKKKELEFLKKADAIISLTANAKKEIIQWKDCQDYSYKISVIPCCADLTLFSANSIDKEIKINTKKRLGISDNEFTISYLGSIGTWYMIDEMLDFFSCLIKRKPNSRFLFITQDNKNDIYLRAKKKAIPVSSVIIVAAKREEVPIYLSCSDLAVYFIKPLYSKKASSPTKMAEILGMGIPILTNRGIGDVDAQFKENKIGLLIESFSEKEYIKAIEDFDVILNIEKNVLVRFAINNYSLEKGINLYKSVYSKII